MTPTTRPRPFRFPSSFLKRQFGTGSRGELVIAFMRNEGSRPSRRGYGGTGRRWWGDGAWWVHGLGASPHGHGFGAALKATAGAGTGAEDGGGSAVQDDCAG